MDMNTKCFLLKLFSILYLYEVEKLNNEEISQIMNEESEVITTYYHIGQNKSSQVQKRWGGQINDEIETSTNKSLDGG